MPYRLRPRTAADLRLCVDTLRRTHDRSGYPTFWPGDPAAWLSPPGLLGAWVADEDGVVVGHVAATATALGSDEYDDWHRILPADVASLTMVSRLFVDPDAQGRGIGRALLDHVVADARRGGRRAALDVVESGTSAIALYEAAGLARVGSAPWRAAGGETLSLLYYAAPDGPA